MDKAVLTIYRCGSVDEIDDLRNAITVLEQVTPISIKKDRLPGAFGELAGSAIEILVSNPVQALATTITIGTALWTVIKVANRAGKRIKIGKPLARPLILSLETDKVNKEIENVIVWGPMEATPIGGVITSCVPEIEDAEIGSIMYFMAIATSKPNGRVQTLWYMLAPDGKLCASWNTQTLRERVPEFLRPTE